jgi:hypothetical protein
MVYGVMVGFEVMAYIFRVFLAAICIVVFLVATAYSHVDTDVSEEHVP